MMRKIGSIAFGIALMLVLGGCDAKQKAKEELEQKGISYSQESFAKSIVSNNKDVVELFFKAGIDLNTPEILEALVNSDDMGIIKKALESGLNPNAKANGVPLIVMLVVDKKNNPKLKDLLEDKNLNINLQYDQGPKDLPIGNALLMLVVNDNLGAFEMLVKKGADTKMVYTISNNDGKLKTNIAGLLLAGIPNKISAINALNLLNMIPDLDANSKMINNNGEMSLLHVAAMEMHVDIVKFLISKGANVNAVSEPNKNTPLMATYNGKDIDTEKAEIIEKLLISKGANKSLKDADGITFQQYKNLVVGESITAIYKGGDIANMVFESKNGQTTYYFIRNSRFESKLKVGQSYTVHFKNGDYEELPNIINIK